MTLIEMIARAKRLPRRHPQREALLYDLCILADSKRFIESTRKVPGCLSAMLGLSISLLHMRLMVCEERVGEPV